MKRLTLLLALFLFLFSGCGLLQAVQSTRRCRSVSRVGTIVCQPGTGGVRAGSLRSRKQHRILGFKSD